jgi:hypothetical protein
MIYLLLTCLRAADMHYLRQQESAAKQKIGQVVDLCQPAPHATAAASKKRDEGGSQTSGGPDGPLSPTRRRPQPPGTPPLPQRSERSATALTRPCSPSRATPRVSPAEADSKGPDKSGPTSTDKSPPTSTDKSAATQAQAGASSSTPFNLTALNNFGFKVLVMQIKKCF